LSEKVGVKEIVPKVDAIPTEKEIRQTLKYLQDLQQFIKAAMKQDVDFGYIPGIDKPSLFKPGAEKLRLLTNTTVEVEKTNEIVQIEKDRKFYLVEFCATAKTRDGRILAQAFGSANSLEKKFIKLANTQGFGTVINTIVKMAHKRAFVAVMLMVAGGSSFFTHDVEDWIDYEQS